MVGVRKLLSLMLLVALVTSGLSLFSPAAQAADTGNAAPQTGKIVSAEPGRNAPNILDGTVYSVAQVGNYIVVGGQFTQAQNFNTSTTLTRRNVLAFDATTGRIVPDFAPDPLGTVYKVLPAADGTSVYVAGSFNSAGGHPGRVIRVDVGSGAMLSAFTAPTISGDIRDLEVVGNRLFVAGKFTHINGVAQRALGSLNATTGRRDAYVNNVFAGTHNTRAGAITNVLQISVNKQNNRLMAVGNFTSVDTIARRQIVQMGHHRCCSHGHRLDHQPVHFNVLVQLRDLHERRGVLARRHLLRRWDDRSLRRRAAATRAPPVATSSPASRAASTPDAGQLDGVHRWRHHVDRRGHRQRRLRRWSPALAEQPQRGRPGRPGAVSREGIAALNAGTGMPYSWNPTRARGVGVQDMLATSDGLYVGSDTTLIGQTPGNTYHARIAVLPLAGGGTLPQQQATTLPVDVFRVATSQSQLSKRSFTGTSTGAATNVATGPGWNTSTGAFMVNGVLYKTNTDGTLSQMTFDGTNYGTASAVNTADALVFQTDWHNDAKTITSLFYADGRIYYTKSGTNALYRRGFEVESGVVGQQRFSTTTSGISWNNVRGAFVAGGKLYYANTSGQLFPHLEPGCTRAVAGTSVQLTGRARAGARGRCSPSRVCLLRSTRPGRSRDRLV